MSCMVFVVAFITALMETVTIAHFPYYRFKVSKMLKTCICTSVLSSQL